MQDDCTHINAVGVERILEVFDDGGVVGSHRAGKACEVTDLGKSTASEAVAWLLQ